VSSTTKTVAPAASNKSANARATSRRSTSPDATSSSWIRVRSATTPSLVQTLAQRHGDRASTIGNGELAIEAADVGLHRVLSDHELGRNALVRVAGDQKRQHFALTLGQAQPGTRPELARVDPRSRHCDPTGKCRI